MAFKYGPRLTAEEYERRVAELYRRASEDLVSRQSAEAARALQREEFRLTVDHRLGVDFPQARRNALWEAKQRADGQKRELAAAYLRKSITSGSFADGMQVMLERTLEEFSKVLSAEELDAFAGPGGSILPLDPDLLGE